MQLEPQPSASTGSVTSPESSAGASADPSASKLNQPDSPTLPPAPALPPLAGLPQVDLDDEIAASFAMPDILDAPVLKNFTTSELYDMNQQLIDESIPLQPLIDEIAPMQRLREEYEQGNPTFLVQISSLTERGYGHIRRTRGDGDCFYRSLAFAYVERVLEAQDRDLALGSAMSILEPSQSILEAVGFQKLVFEDFYEAFASLIHRVAIPDVEGKLLNGSALLGAFQNSETSNAIVVYLRLLTSAHIRTDPESYEPFLFDPETGEPMAPREFCERFVEATGKEADHVQIMALSQALKLNIDIAYLDGRGQGGNVDFVQFRNAPDQDADPLILLYRPGHYDILIKAWG